MRQFLLWLGLALALAAAPVVAQDQTGENAPTAVEPAADGAELDYALWERMAERAEAEIENRNTQTDRMEEIRSQLAKWRAALLNAQSANSARIATLRQQIEALGPAPADGAVEADEISARRSELASQLVKLQAPGIAADEAYRRADGLIDEIDRTLRERQADRLLQLWPSPLNPGNWPEAAIGFADTVQRLWDETAEAWETPKARGELFDNLPLIIVLVIVAVALVVYVRRWTERFTERLQQGATVRGRNFWAVIASLGGIVLPTLGVVALSWALLASGMLGEVGSLIAVALPFAGFVVFSAAWLGARAFPRLQGDGAVLPLPPERRAEGRFLSVMMGLVIAANMLRAAAMDAQAYSDATTSVMSFPILLTGGLVLMRLGRTLRKTEEKGTSYALRLIQLLARGLTVLGVVGPVLAGFGYVQAAEAVIYPAMLSFALVAFLFILQRMIGDAWALIAKSEETASDALVPVLAGFALSIASLPVLALIWGARFSDLTELWTRFTEGFSLGGATISPTDFMIFAIVFVIGYMLTRLFQGALRTTILPKTKMDQGGQTALVAGVGYVGVFLAALIAINAAGIDLSGLAIVAGALSVGIGFGLQTIVSNFVSGIILLVERPVSEGDWIEVGGVQGKVRAISVRSTRIETFDRNDVIVPNADLITGRVTNWTRFNLSGRIIVPVAVALGSDTRAVEKLLREIAEEQPMAILNPPPVVSFMGYTATQLNFEIRVILRDVNFGVQVRSDMNHRILQRLAEAGIPIVPPPAPPAAPDPMKAAEAVLALADLVESEKATRGPAQTSAWGGGCQRGRTMTDLLFREDAYQTAADCQVIGHTAEGGILVDRSIFYATSGGQPGDSGMLDWGASRVPIATALKVGGSIALIPAEPVAMPPIGAPARQLIDWTRRHRHMRVHTALHLLSVVIPLPVTGGQIGADKGRLDFDMPEPPGDVAALEEALNSLIARDLTVSDDWITDDELLANPGLVKTMSVRPPMGQGRVRLVRITDGATLVDLQPCGGTHVRRTSEIGRVEIGRIENKGRQNRRVTITLA